jgi:hypothetical protein
MNSDLAKDRLVTHALTNYLAAAYHGKFAALNILAQLDHPAFTEAELMATQQTLGKVFNWNSQLFKDECLFSASWTTPETFEAQNAVSLLEQLKPELYKISAESGRILALDTLPQKDELAILIAFHARHAYSRDAYVRGFMEYGEKFSRPEMVKRYEPFIPESEFELRRNNELILLLKNAKGDISLLPKEYFALLFQTAVPLPSYFRSHVHDINQLLCPYKGGLSWTTAEFSKAEAEMWNTAGLGPSAAGYFRAFGMGPDEAGKWREGGVSDAMTAIEWKKGGFTPETAKPWLDEGIPPPLAFMWSQNQFSPTEAKEFISKGTFQPPPRDTVPRKREKPEAPPAIPPPKKMSFPKKI